LAASQRHRSEARKIAAELTRLYRENPHRRIYLTSHSAGTGVAAFALAQLPDDVRIESWLLLASALSPQYDLSPALRPVRTKAYSLYSPHDWIVGWGTRNFGTIDRIKTDSGGLIGFTPPENAADVWQYEKLVQIPYDNDWMRLGNNGDHIGTMMPRFSRQMLAPLLLTGELPTVEQAIHDAGTAQPAAKTP
jgi:pimeloyl-ACP methyl ester carboxylesterase